MNPKEGNAVILQGEIYREQEKLDEALASFDKATELAPQSPAPYQNRGEIYRQQKKYQKAIEQFNEVLKLQPDFLTTLLHRADAYMADGQLEKSLADLDVVLEKKQDLVNAHRLRAAILANLGRLNDAIEEQEKLSAAVPGKPEHKLRLVIYYLAGNQYSKAITAYSDVLDVQKDNFGILQARGSAYLSIGKHAEAIAILGEPLKLNPQDATLLNNLAWVLATTPEPGYAMVNKH